MMENETTLLTKQQVAQMLGMKESMITGLVAAGEIPHLRLGKRKFIRFRPQDIDTWLDSKMQGNK